MSLSFNCTEKHLEIGVFPELLRWIKVSMIPSYCYVQGLWGGECFSFTADANEDIWLLKHWSGEQVPLLSGKNEKYSGFFLEMAYTKHWTTKANDDGKNPWFYYLWKQCHFVWIISHFMWFTYGICLSLCAVCAHCLCSYCSLLPSISFNVHCGMMYDVCIPFQVSGGCWVTHILINICELTVICFWTLLPSTGYQTILAHREKVSGKKNNKPKKTERRKTQI